MLRRVRPPSRLAGVAVLLVQLALQTGVAWRDARAEGLVVRQESHVEQLGARHAQHAHAAECAISQHLQAHSSPASRVRAPTAVRAAALSPPPQPAQAPPRWVAAATLSRGPPAVA
ncbi:MAG TPA: hypothetical protein VFZ11_02940 [Gemmatimonadaceae bacterium]